MTLSTEIVHYLSVLSAPAFLEDQSVIEPSKSTAPYYFLSLFFIPLPLEAIPVIQSTTPRISLSLSRLFIYTGYSSGLSITKLPTICFSCHCFSSTMENSTDHLHDPYEAEEALSLCDLPIYSDESNWEDYSKEEQRLSSSDNDFFEFFSEDFSTAASTTPNKNDIIFCGKLMIPYKDIPDPEKTHDENPKQNQMKKGFLRWKSLSFSKKKGDSFSNCDFSVEKATVLAPPTKSRWYLFLFGIGRLPTEMELRDIKTRQSRLRSQSKMVIPFPSVECDEMVKGGARAKGLWTLLIKVLACTSSTTLQTNAAVNASAACIYPHVR